LAREMGRLFHRAALAFSASPLSPVQTLRFGSQNWTAGFSTVAGVDAGPTGAGSKTRTVR